MSEKLFIGIGHKARHGKDTFAAAIHREYPHLTRVIGFADALKSYCRVVHGMAAKDGPLLQRVGVELRGINPAVWIDALYWTAMDAREPVILVPDTRFENEAEFIKDNGGVLVKVERRTIAMQPFVTTDRDPNHESETALDSWPEWDYIVENWEGCKHQLRVSALTVFEEVFERWEKQKAMVEILRDAEGERRDDAA